MIKSIIMCLFIILLVSEYYCQLTVEERNSLFKRYIKKISFDKFQVSNKNSYYSRGKNISQITYEVSKIKGIIEKYNFPEKYNFIEEEKPNVHIKSQGSCGSCWAFASTTALSYRFHKLGIEVDLSPQYLLSCYIKNCSIGDYLIDTQFYLAKNGTVTENCMPYSSKNGKTVEKCPNECKNGEVFKKYYSKNAYSTVDDYNEENYYDIVTIIMDQLVNFGPVVSNIETYDDFGALHGNKSCPGIIYRHNSKKGEEKGSHAVVIVGYGFEDSKFFWIIQNSWGVDFCDKGFLRVEFAQISIERIAFSEPYIPNDKPGKDISLDLQLNEDCKFTFITDLNETEENYLEMNFKSINSQSNRFYYQCSVPSFKNNKEGLCPFQAKYWNNLKGYYKLNDYKSLKKDNSFNLNFKDLSKNQFWYYGIDYIDAIYDYDLYISEERSFIILIYYNKTEDYNLITNIYPNINSKEKLKCNSFDIWEDNFTLIYCGFSSNQIKEFSGKNSELPLVYDILCGQKEEMLATVNILDKTKYPVFIIKKMLLEKKYLKHRSNITLLANIEGSISQFKQDNTFGAFIHIKAKKSNSNQFLHCDIPKLNKNEITCLISCYLYFDDSIVYYDDIELYPYFYPKIVSSPFEVIKDSEAEYEIIDDEDYPEDEEISDIIIPKIPIGYQTLEYSRYFIIFIILLL